MKKEIIKMALKPKNVRDSIEFMKLTGQEFDVIVQTYTTQIKSDAGKFLFMDKSHSFKMFAAYSKLKKDITSFNSWAGEFIPDIKNPTYFEHKFTEENFIPDVWNFDINSAYLCALYQWGMITTETYEYCKTLKKADRLACVGMLASKKMIFHYSDTGNLYGLTEQRADTSKYFFWAVNYITEAMQETARWIEIKNTFLFYWVDGIYCVPIEPENIFENFIFANLKRDFGLDIKLEKLKAFNIKKKGKKWKVNYFKEGKKKEFLFSQNSEADKLKSQILKIAQS